MDAASRLVNAGRLRMGHRGDDKNLQVDEDRTVTLYRHNNKAMTGLDILLMDGHT